LKSAASGYADQLVNNATPNPNSNLTAARLPRVCYDIGQALEENFPSECQKFMNHSITLTTGGFRRRISDLVAEDMLTSKQL
jgi:hypothetical protein